MKKITIIGSILLIITSCNNQDNNTVQPDNTDKKIAVRAVRAEQVEYIPSIKLSGTAFADKEANLGSALPGRVEKVYYPEGTKVRKGELLVSLSGELYTQALVENKAILKDFERVSRLVKKGSITRQDYDHVKARYDASCSKVEMMKKNSEIVAPFSGTIIEYLVNEGENYLFNINLDPGYSVTSGVVRLMKLDPVQVETEINEKDLGKIKTGQKALITFDAVKDTVFEGKISAIKPVLSTLTHTATIKIEINNSTGIIKPGMFAHINIELKPENDVCIPMGAIYRQAGTVNNYVFVIDGNRVRRQQTDRLWTNGDKVGVTGVNQGDIVVTSGKEKLNDGSLVEIKK